MDGIYFLVFQAAFIALAYWVVQAEKHGKPDDGYFGIHPRSLGREEKAEKRRGRLAER